MTDVRFGGFLARVTACHVVTYFVCGVIAYGTADGRYRDWMFSMFVGFALDQALANLEQGSLRRP